MNKSTPYFSVLIVNYNGGHFLQGALNSLKSQTFRDFEVIVIDNNSTDGSATDLDTTGLPGIRLLMATENHGFAGGNNLAAREASGRWLALLNPDAEAQVDWLESIANGIKRHPDVSSFACTQISMHDEQKLDGAGDNYLLWGIPWRGGYGQDRSNLPEEGECFTPCGASAVYAHEVFKAHGGFDERLFCFCEDVDLGFRMQLSGQRCVFLPSAVVRHAGGGLSEKVSGFATKLGTRNRLWVYMKNMPFALLVLTLPVHILLTIGILLRGFMTGQFGHASEGLIEAIANLPKGVSGRRELQKNRKVCMSYLLRRMPINPVRLLTRSTFVKPMN